MAEYYSVKPFKSLQEELRLDTMLKVGGGDKDMYLEGSHPRLFWPETFCSRSFGMNLTLLSPHFIAFSSSPSPLNGIKITLVTCD